MRVLVSIITPAYNCDEFLIQTYQSLRNQNIVDWEWLVTEDRSTDNTYSVLKSICEYDNRVKIFQNEVNSGAAVSRNNSLNRAKGKYISFIDSDDVWKENKLERQIHFMEELDLEFSFTAYELINACGKEIGKSVDTHLTESISYQDMLRKKATLGCSTVMLRRDSFDDISMPLIRTGQDYALWLKLLKTGVNAQPIPEILTQYRILPGSISRNKFKKAKRQWEIYRKIQGLPLHTSIECFFFYAWRAVFRK